jgi:transposase
MKIAKYDSSLSDAQWSLLKLILPKRAKRGRPPTDLRRILDAILYVLKGGIPWRLLPSDFPPWQTVYHVFRKWARENVWAALNDLLRPEARALEGKLPQPTAAILDSQSVKSDPHGGKVGYDAAKRIKGRKRHLLVDTLGLVLGATVTPANVPEREGALDLLKGTLGNFKRVLRLWVDGGYGGSPFAEKVGELRPKLEVEVVKRSDDVKGFKVLPRRWVVERTFAWLMRHRRLVRDYETSESSAEAWIYLAMTRIQIRRLA